MAVKKMLEPCGNDFTPSAKNKQVCDNCGFIKRKHICNCGCGLGLHISAVEPAVPFAKRINPRNFGFSPNMTAIVGAIIRHDYGVRDSRGGRLTSISITSDGFVIATSTASSGGGALLCRADVLERNLEQYRLILASEGCDEDAEEFSRIYKVHVPDWRN